MCKNNYKMSYLDIDRVLINNIINKINNNEDIPFDIINPMNYSERDWTYIFVYLTKYCQIFKKDNYCEKIYHFWTENGKYMTSKLLVDFFITENIRDDLIKYVFDINKIEFKTFFIDFINSYHLADKTKDINEFKDSNSDKKSFFDLVNELDKIENYEKMINIFGEQPVEIYDNFLKICSKDNDDDVNYKPIAIEFLTKKIKELTPNIKNPWIKNFKIDINYQESELYMIFMNNLPDIKELDFFSIPKIDSNIINSAIMIYQFGDLIDRINILLKFFPETNNLNYLVEIVKNDEFFNESYRLNLIHGPLLGKKRMFKNLVFKNVCESCNKKIELRNSLREATLYDWKNKFYCSEKCYPNNPMCNLVLEKVIYYGILN